jgi:hypothetical protein
VEERADSSRVENGLRWGFGAGGIMVEWRSRGQAYGSFSDVLAEMG